MLTLPSSLWSTRSGTPWSASASPTSSCAREAEGDASDDTQDHARLAAERPVWDPMSILTIEDVARYCAPTNGVSDNSSSAASFRASTFAVSRIQAGALIRWVKSEMHLKSLETLKRTLQNRETWAWALEDDPELKAQVILDRK